MIFVTTDDFVMLHICMCKLPDIVISVNTVMLHIVIFVNTHDFGMLHICMCKLHDTVIFVNTDDFLILHIFICKLQDISVNTDDCVMLHVFVCELQDILIFVNTGDCYIVEAHPEQAWDTLVSHEDDLHRLTVSYSVVCVT